MADKESKTDDDGRAEIPFFISSSSFRGWVGWGGRSGLFRPFNVANAISSTQRINHDVLTVIEGIHKEREVKQEVLSRK
jgi:hypothetical protein